MKEYNEFLQEEIEKKYAKFLRCKDLVELGLYNSPSALSLAIKRDTAPPYVRISNNKILFPKKTLLVWLKSKFIVDKNFSPK